MMSLESFLRLGWSFFKTVLHNLVVRRPQLPRFLAQYRPDGMHRSEAGDHAVLVGASRCLVCGLCDARALELNAWEVLGRRGPMAFVLSGSRMSRGLEAVAPSRAVLDELTQACPVKVPFVPLAALVERRRRELVEGIAVRGVITAG
jgi:hypothetical protein